MGLPVLHTVETLQDRKKTHERAEFEHPFGPMPPRRLPFVVAAGPAIERRGFATRGVARDVDVNQALSFDIPNDLM